MTFEVISVNDPVVSCEGGKAGTGGTAEAFGALADATIPFALAEVVDDAVVSDGFDAGGALLERTDVTEAGLFAISDELPVLTGVRLDVLVVLVVDSALLLDAVLVLAAIRASARLPLVVLVGGLPALERTDRSEPGVDATRDRVDLTVFTEAALATATRVVVAAASFSAGMLPFASTLTGAAEGVTGELTLRIDADAPLLVEAADLGRSVLKAVGVEVAVSGCVPVLFDPMTAGVFASFGKASATVVDVCRGLSIDEPSL